MPKTNWPMTNVYNPWPVYSDGGNKYIIAVKINKIQRHVDGSINLVPDGEFDDVYESALFDAVFKPSVGGYLVRDSGNQDLYIDEATFVKTYHPVAVGQKGPKGDRGEPGTPGPKGDKGDTGPQGPAGKDGSSQPGAKGDKGDKGDTGAQGPKGDKGDKGEPGAGSVKDLPATTDLNTVTTPGRYRLTGSDKSMQLNYPLPVLADSEVYLDVTLARGYGSSAVVTQTFTGSQLGNQPGPYVRNNADGNKFGTWAVNVTELYITGKTVALLNVSQNDFNVAAVVGSSNVHSYQTPDDTSNTPNKKTAPSAFGGVKLALRWQFSKSRQGTFGGAVLAVDEKGKAFLQTDYNVPSNNDGSISESSINWQEFITSPVKDRKAIADATDATQTQTINAVLALLRERGLLQV